MRLVFCIAADAYMNLADYWLLYNVVTHDQRSAMPPERAFPGTYGREAR